MPGFSLVYFPPTRLPRWKDGNCAQTDSALLLGGEFFVVKDWKCHLPGDVPSQASSSPWAVAKAAFALRNVLQREDSQDVMCGRQESPFDPSHKNAVELRIRLSINQNPMGTGRVWLPTQVPGLFCSMGRHFQSLLEVAGVEMVNP